MCFLIIAELSIHHLGWTAILVLLGLVLPTLLLNIIILLIFGSNEFDSDGRKLFYKSKLFSFIIVLIVFLVKVMGDISIH